jgi:hypothetical protein
MLGQEGGALHLKELTAAEPEGGGFFGLGLMNHPKVALSTAAGTVVLAFTDGGQADFLEQVQAAWKESKATAAAASAAAPTQASASGLLDSSIPSMASLFGTPGQASPPLPPTPCFAPAPAQGAATAEQQAHGGEPRQRSVASPGPVRAGDVTPHQAECFRRRGLQVRYRSVCRCRELPG